jgi:hypothetical protein
VPGTLTKPAPYSLHDFTLALARDLTAGGGRDGGVCEPGSTSVCAQAASASVTASTIVAALRSIRRHPRGASYQFYFLMKLSLALRIAANIAKLPQSACALPRVGFGLVGHTFERSVVGFLVSLGLLRLGLIRLLLVFVTAAAHALRVSADRR